MPMHDWTRVDQCLFQALHHGWVAIISRTLNCGLLPKDYYALLVRQTEGFGPDPMDKLDGTDDGAFATTYADLSPDETYRRRKSSISVRRADDHRIVAVIDVLVPSNKSELSAMQAYAEKAQHLLKHGVHLLLVDSFPPGKHDPGGTHDAIWSEIGQVANAEPSDKSMVVVSYQADDRPTAFLNMFHVGEPLPDGTVFLPAERHVLVPLEETYQKAWADLPAPVKELFGE